MSNPWTQGPWRAYCGKDYTRVMRDRQGSGDETGSVEICHIAGPEDADLRKYNRGRWEADAHLIAAAPEIAEMLEQLADAVMSHTQWSGDPPEQVRNARTLLSRIRGEQT